MRRERLVGVRSAEAAVGELQPSGTAQASESNSGECTHDQIESANRAHQHDRHCPSHKALSDSEPAAVCRERAAECHRCGRTDRWLAGHECCQPAQLTPPRQPRHHSARSEQTTKRKVNEEKKRKERTAAVQSRAHPVQSPSRSIVSTVKPNDHEISNAGFHSVVTSSDEAIGVCRMI